MNEPKTPWPDEAEASRRFRESQRTGHTQLVLKCKNCGLEFIILTWRTGPELAAAFGVYTDVDPLGKVTSARTRDGKILHCPQGAEAARNPDAEQVSCPECGKRGDVALCNYRRARGPICGLGQGGAL